jgi:FMN phosphatase YigB (HAD superfamily)
MRRRRPWNRVLTVYPQVVFVDWHGVLSDSRFWRSVQDHPAVTAQVDFDSALANLFSSSAVDEWMRGRLTTHQVVGQFLVTDGDPRLVEFLAQQVVRECAESTTRRRLVQVLKSLRETHHLVLATDNMDCFSAALPGRRDLMSVFDDYLTSAEVGVLKAENPGRFFLPWLEEHNIPVEAAVLVDDRRKNCDRFMQLGGQAIVFDRSPAMWSQLAALAGS